MAQLLDESRRAFLWLFFCFFFFFLQGVEQGEGLVHWTTASAAAPKAPSPPKHALENLAPPLR